MTTIIKDSAPSNPQPSAVKPATKKERTNSGHGHSNIQSMRKRLGVEIFSEDPTTIFTLQERLGKGSFGSVYKAINNKTGNVVALKLISLDADEALEDVRKEIQILAECNHPNIVSYYGSYFKDDNLWIAMEYCGGGSVSDILQVLESPFNEAQIALIIREALKGLKYLHSIHKIHRDIKGGNILLTETGEVKLADFGVSAQLFSTFSKRNTFVGTPYWMAPEVMQESSYDGKADVWSLGITAIEMAEIVPPNSDVHPMRIIFLLPREPPPKLTDKKGWSPAFHEFLARCLIKDPKLRPSAEKLLEDKFVSKCKGPPILVELIENYKRALAQRGGKSNYLDAEEELDNEEGGNPAFSSMIVHEGAGGGRGEVVHVAGGGGKKKPAKKRVAADPSRGFGLQDKLQAIHRKDCTIPIPFIPVSCISPLHMLTASNSNAAYEAICELSPDHPLAIQTGNINPQLNNLIAIHLYHKERLESVPMTPKELEQTNRLHQDLTTVLKTILRV
eukprot:TRINITY_DN7496_c0_g1_i1.p1 TRINITY_DN7496_c0_g1~~TRINITY_DN7496_c0_g1_i1.p1  ORF type:complete len:505 (-),score=80.43 TRINITY_DN7496_c0_g1_i1:141-1655(-)